MYWRKPRSQKAGEWGTMPNATLCLMCSTMRLTAGICVCYCVSGCVWPCWQQCMCYDVFQDVFDWGLAATHMCLCCVFQDVFEVCSHTHVFMLCVSECVWQWGWQQPVCFRMCLTMRLTAMKSGRRRSQEKASLTLTWVPFTCVCMLDQIGTCLGNIPW